MAREFHSLFRSGILASFDRNQALVAPLVREICWPCSPFSMAALSSPFKSALLLSLVIHGLLLAWGIGRLPPTASAAAGPIQVNLRAASVVPEPMSHEVRPEPVSRPHALKPPSPLPRDVSPVLAVPLPRPDPVPGGGAVPQESRQETRNESGSRGAPSAAAASSGGDAVAAPLLREGVSGDALRQYRLALALEARRFKRYPRLARERGWEGTVEVSVLLGSQGPATAMLQRSSGQPLLDEQGLEMIRLALGATPLPEPLRGRELRLVLPVQFFLEE